MTGNVFSFFKIHLFAWCIIIPLNAFHIIAGSRLLAAF